MGATETSMFDNSSLAINCYGSMVASYISRAFFLTKLLLVMPFIILVLFLSVLRWRRQQQGCVPPASHSDVFTCHVSVFELVNVFGYILYYWGHFAGVTKMAVVGEIVLRCTFLGPLIFHIMACVDRYMAVVFPITYMRLRQLVSIRIQIISTVCVWLLSSTLGIFALLEGNYFAIFLSVQLAIFVVIISMFSLHILCALKHAGPEDMGIREGRSKVSQSRQRAAYMVMAITGSLWMWFFGILLPIILMNSSLRSDKHGCLVTLAGFWFSLPGNLVLPLLYLRKVGKWS